MQAGTLINFFAVTVISLILFIAPLCIDKIRKPSWEQEVQQKLNQE